jgi:DNA topoisomerase II
MAVSIEKRYQKLTDTEHVLLRPGMYIGSIKPHTEEVYLLNEKSRKFEPTEITYNPGFLKMFDEIVSNSVDEHKRNPKLNQIKITVDKTTGRISIWDNGGIPVEIHKEYGEWVPEMIFSNLKTGSNFDDTEDRIVVGTNGVGSTLTNIFSKEFKIETCDGKKQFTQVFTDNMSNRSEPIIKPAKKGFTEISYIADFQRFGMKGIDDASIRMIQKRLYDIAACNHGVKIFFNEKQISFVSFKEYAELYTDYVFYEQSPNWKVGIGHSTVGFKAISFVNSVETKDGGTHVNNVTHQIIQDLREKIKKKYRVDVKPAELKQHLFLFIDCTIINPAFSSQTKEKLITEPKDYGSTHELSEKILKQIFSSEIIQSVLDWIERKKAAEERAKLRKLNNNLDKSKVLKLIDAKKNGDRKGCTLAIFEGDSASSAFRRYRDPQTQGAFPLRGKFINVREIPDSKVVQNKEVQSLMAAIGLKIGHEPKDLRYGKILFYTDADVDGNSISALLINFFGKYWPELFDEGRVLKIETPLMVAKKGKETLSFYSDDDYKVWEGKQKSLASWNIEYKKGLAALEDEEYQEIIRSPRSFILTKDNGFNSTLEIWFSGDSIPRKKKILGEAVELKSNSNKKSLF